MRDVTLGDTIDFKFNTCEPDTGAPITLAGTPVISAYVGNGTTEITAGITLTVDFDSRTGLHNVRAVLTSGNGYTAGTDVSFVITTGTVDGVSAVGVMVYELTIGRAITANVTQWHGSDLLTGTGPLAGLGVLDRGTAQSDSTTSLQLRSTVTFANDELNGATALFYSATTGAGQRSLITDYVGSTDTATIDTLVTDPTGTVRYEIYGTAASSGGAGLDAAGVRAAIGLASANLDTQLTNIDNFIDTEVGALVTAVAAVQADTDNIQTRLPAALVGGLMTVDVLAWDGVAVDPMQDAAEIADTILSVNNSDYLIAGTVGANISAGGSGGGGGGLDAAGVRAAVGLSAADLETRLTLIASYVDTEVTGTLNAVNSITVLVDTEIAGIKAKTDQLVFTKTNELDVNVQSYNGVTLTGTGAPGNLFSV